MNFAKFRIYCAFFKWNFLKLVEANGCKRLNVYVTGFWDWAEASGDDNKHLFLTPIKVLVVSFTDFILFPVGSKFFYLEKYFVKD